MSLKIRIYLWDHHHHRGHKQRNLAIRDNMDGPEEWYAKWNKSDEETQISYELPHAWNLK